MPRRLLLLSALLIVLVLVALLAIQASRRTSQPSGSASGAEERRERSTPAPEGRTGVLPRPVPGLLEVYFLDVSLGDAIYIRMPDGEDMIIDGGDSANELSAYLDDLGELAIDVLIATHPHADHIGGLARVIRERDVLQVWTDGTKADTKVDKDFEVAVAGKGIPERFGKPGDAFSTGKVRFTVLAPLKVGSNVNDNSLVVRMDCGTSSFLFAGDAEKASEDRMIVEKENLDVDILKLGHHGSRYSSSSEMILTSSPKLAIYQARVGNQYGHPDKETLERLADQHVPVFGTGVASGTVIVATACDGQYSVSPHLDGFADLATTTP